MPILVPEVAVPVPAEGLPSAPLIDAVWDYLPAYIPAADDGTLWAYLAAGCAPVEPTVALLASGGDMVDPAKASAARLPWVAAMAGVDLTSVPDSEARAFIADPDTRYRGNVTAIRRRVGLTLTGSRTVQIECPYEGDELAILVRTFTVETPDATATEAAIRAEVPAWLVVTIDVADGIDYDDLNTAFDDYDDMTTTGGSYNDLSNIQPTP